MNIVDLVEYQARTAPNALAVAYPGGVATYRMLMIGVTSAAGHLSAARVDRRGIVAVQVGNPLLHLVLVLALARRGIASVSVRHAGDAAEAGLDVSAILTERYPDRAVGQVVIVDETWLIPAANAKHAPEPAPPVGEDDLCSVVLSSGTTGRPKCIGLTHGMIVGRIMRYYGVLPDPTNRRLSMIGFSAYGGLLNALMVLWQGGLLSFAQAPEQVCELTQLFQLQSLSATPIQLRSLLEHVAERPVFLPSLRSIVVSGGRAARPILDAVRMQLCPNVRITYASTETCITAHGPVSAMAGVEGAAGFILPWVRMEAVDDGDRPVPFGEAGHLRVRTPFAVSRYLVPTPGDEEIFRDGWLYYGDVGTIREDGFLVISGRAQDTVSRGGAKVSPERLEERLAAVAGLPDHAVVSMPQPDGIDQIWIAVAGLEEARLDDVRVLCTRAMGDFPPDRLVRVDTIPRNQMGKIVRAELRALLQGS